MSKDFKQYKKQKDMENAYKIASNMMEGFILNEYYGTCSAVAVSTQMKNYEGHLCIIDIMNKIDAMVKMFERTLEQSPNEPSLSKFAPVIDSLFDLAQSKLIESRKQTTSYLNKIGGNSYGDMGSNLPGPTEDIPSSTPTTFKASDVAAVGAKAGNGNGISNGNGRSFADRQKNGNGNMDRPTNGQMNSRSSTDESDLD